jgi:prepilin-type N-terminal cleavage/methylation domain-containing protein
MSPSLFPRVRVGPSLNGFRASKGFTLIEIMIAVVLIGLLAALAIPAFKHLTTRANDTLFINELRVASHSLERYALEKGDWPPDGGGGWPPEMEGYLPPPARWHQQTPLGGFWSWTRDNDGINAALRITGYTGGETRALRIDRMFDDGDLAAGYLQGTAANLVYVMQR